MGYTTEFSGSVTIDPPLNQEENDYLRKFSDTRRMHRKNGPYFVDGTGDFGQGRDADIINFNDPPPGQPSLWCQWVPSDDGTTIEWDGGEKLYCAEEWMAYIIDHFLKPGAEAKASLPFLQANHVCNGDIEAQGEDADDRWLLRVRNNKVTTHNGTVVYEGGMTCRTKSC